MAFPSIVKGIFFLYLLYTLESYFCYLTLSSEKCEMKSLLENHLEKPLEDIFHQNLNS